jgi:hypothetical protein
MANGKGGQSAPGLRVLVVEDNADAAERLALVLRTYGDDVRIAADGPAALALAQAEAPDAVLLDLGLPGMDGYEVAPSMVRPAGPGLGMPGLGAMKLAAPLGGAMLPPAMPKPVGQPGHPKTRAGRARRRHHWACHLRGQAWRRLPCLPHR